MADLTSRPDSWTDYLPETWQTAINTSPLMSALGRALNRPAPNLEKASLDIFGRPEDKAEADRQWLLQQARGPSWLERANPVVQDGVNKLGMLANFVGPGVKLPAAAPKPTGIRAYHGSPHDFDRFDINKIGTGEGAQAYGPGLYFAESEGVARSYKEGLGNKSYLLDGKPIQPSSPAEYDAHQLLMRYGPDIDAAILRGKQDIARGHEVDVAQLPPAVALLEKWKAEGRYNGDNTGRMYEVRINADPDQFLDWDKPLAQQPEAVKKAIGYDLPPQVEAEASRLARQLEETYARLGATTDRRAVDPILIRQADDLEKRLTAIDPKGLHKQRVDLIAGDRGASERLREAGIPGIKYLDQGSRAAGQGSRNYVVFDDKLIEILRKYGLLPPVAAGTAATLNQEQPQQ